MQMVLSAINIYPIKSLGGITLQEARVEQRGLQYDRRWLLVNEEGTAITQRDHSRMALCSIRVTPEGLEVNAPGMEPLLVPFHPNHSEPITVKIWSSVC